MAKSSDEPVYHLVCTKHMDVLPHTNGLLSVAMHYKLQQHSSVLDIPLDIPMRLREEEIVETNFFFFGQDL